MNSLLPEDKHHIIIVLWKRCPRWPSKRCSCCNDSSALSTLNAKVNVCIKKFMIIITLRAF